MKKHKQEIQKFVFRWREQNYHISAVITPCDCGLTSEIEIGGSDIWLAPNPLPTKLHNFARAVVEAFHATEFNAIDIDQWLVSNNLNTWQKELMNLLPKEGA